MPSFTSERNQTSTEHFALQLAFKSKSYKDTYSYFIEISSIDFISSLMSGNVNVLAISLQDWV